MILLYELDLANVRSALIASSISSFVVNAPGERRTVPIGKVPIVR